ncbi:MAG TPA: choice-of-anchor V domain-containing protein [Candidatus Thermoplasmatota archaeon]|nr:choice-of-anchor V domain-containing protein [Candidatus Thermoplasmatota archaeon]
MRAKIGLVLVGMLAAAVWITAPAASNANGAPDPAFDTGCGCHGSASTAVTVALTGPEAYEAGTSYDLTLRVTGGPMPLPVASQNTGGFAIKVNVGKFVPGSGQQLKNDGFGLTHTTQGNDQRTWSFAWNAPAQATDAAVFTFWGNAVNGDTTSQGDQWNTGKLTVPALTTNATQNATAPPAKDDTPSLPALAGIGVLVAVAVWSRRRG